MFKLIKKYFYKRRLQKDSSKCHDIATAIQCLHSREESSVILTFNQAQDLLYYAASALQERANNIN